MGVACEKWNIRRQDSVERGRGAKTERVVRQRRVEPSSHRIRTTRVSQVTHPHAPLCQVMNHVQSVAHGPAGPTCAPPVHPRPWSAPGLRQALGGPRWPQTSYPCGFDPPEPHRLPVWPAAGQDVAWWSRRAHPVFMSAPYRNSLPHAGTRRHLGHNFWNAELTRNPGIFPDNSMLSLASGIGPPPSHEKTPHNRCHQQFWPPPPLVEEARTDDAKR